MVDFSAYFAAHEDLDARQMLADWRWLIGSTDYTIHRIAAIGNVFLRDHAGEIYLLETTDGTFERIAVSENAWAVARANTTSAIRYADH